MGVAVLVTSAEQRPALPGPVVRGSASILFSRRDVYADPTWGRAGALRKPSGNDRVTVLSVPAQCDVLLVVPLNFLNL